MAAQLNPALSTIARQIESLLDAQDMASLRDLIARQHPADIADILETLPEAQRVQLFSVLSTDVAAEVLDETRTEATRELLDAIPGELAADLLEVMPVDDAAELLSELPDEQAEEILALMEPEEAADVGALLAYPDNTAGRLMSTKVVRLKADWTVEHTLQYLRTIDPETETFAYLYVVNGGGRLVGVVPLRALVLASPEKVLSEIMTPSVIAVGVDTDQEEVARQVAQYDFSAMPVVDRAGRLVGVITHDDVVDILQQEFTEDIQRLGGSQPLEGDYLSTPVLTVARKRVGWLLVLFLTEMLTGTVMRLFESELESVVALAFFVPLLIGTGGNSGSQATSTIIRAIAVGEVHFKDTWRLLWHEARTGFMLGVLMGMVGFVRALTWGSSIALSATVGMALFTIVLWANMIGSLLPTLAARLKIDPAVISGPVMSTLVDATGLFIYFMLARLILGL
ncbi:MAG: magnesium transporter [Anaerolineae bacterium]